jgi:hypothetical protein
LKVEAAARGLSMQALFDEAVRSLFVQNSAGLDLPPIPRSLVPIIEFIVDAYAEKRSPEEELWKDTLRALAAERSADLKRSQGKMKPKANAS